MSFVVEMDYVPLLTEQESRGKTILPLMVLVVLMGVQLQDCLVAVLPDDAFSVTVGMRSGAFPKISDELIAGFSYIREAMLRVYGKLYA